MKFLNFIALVVLLAGCVQLQERNNYYFDAENGSNSNTGTNPGNAFKSLDKIHELKIRPGDSILLKSGSIFTEKLFFSGKGSPEHPVVIGKYGGSARPYLKGGSGQMEMVHLFNSENVVVRDLEISNKRDAREYHLAGLKVELKNFGEAHNTLIDNLFIHDVSGGLEISKGGGTALLIQNAEDKDSIPSRFVNLEIENCTIRNSSRDGIRLKGQWIRSKWYPNLGVIIRQNRIDGVPGDGIVVSGCDSARIEFNTLKNFPEILPPTEACDGIWPWSSDNTTVQFNVVSDHHSIVDGYAYDSDWNCRNSVFQFNLSYNNMGGFLLVIATNHWPESWCVNGNYDTRATYNISINDGLRNYRTENRYFSPVVHLTGLTKNTQMEKNLIYQFPKPSPEVDRTILHFTEHDKSYGQGDIFRDNYIFVSEPTVFAKEEKSENNVYAGNLFVGPLNAPETGFESYNGQFDQKMWYDKTDKNWDKLIDFVKDKTVLMNGHEIPVLQIIGYPE